MSAENDLLILLRYEEGVLRKYVQYAQKAGDNELGNLLVDIAREKHDQILKLRGMYKKYCKGG